MHHSFQYAQISWVICTGNWKSRSKTNKSLLSTFLGWIWLFYWKKLHFGWRTLIIINENNCGQYLKKQKPQKYQKTKISNQSCEKKVIREINGKNYKKSCFGDLENIKLIRKWWITCWRRLINLKWCFRIRF